MKYLSLSLGIMLLLACNNNSSKAPVYSSNNDSISDTSIDIIWYGMEFDTTLGDSTSKFNVNEQYCETAPPSVKAALGFVSTIMGTDCQWDGEANDSLTNLKCKLTSALGLGYQCSDTHLNFLRQWFRNDKIHLNKLNSCYSVPYTASSQNIISAMKLEIKNDSIIISFSASGINMRTEKSWTYNGSYTFQVRKDELRLIYEHESDLEYKSFGEDD